MRAGGKHCHPLSPVALCPVTPFLFSRTVLLGLLCNFAAALPSARAGDYLYPKDDPAFNLTLPDGWTIAERPGPAQLLLCTPGSDASYIISVMRVPNVGSREDLATTLARITQTGASGAGLDAVTVAPAVEVHVGPGARVFTKVTASGKHEGSDGAYTYYAFNLVAGGKYYAVGVAGMQAMIDAHKAEFEKVALSIRPLK